MRGVVKSLPKGTFVTIAEFLDLATSTDAASVWDRMVLTTSTNADGLTSMVIVHLAALKDQATLKDRTVPS